jgi:myo-inositol-hexaphosphate 3-phosphohydrolase
MRMTLSAAGKILTVSVIASTAALALLDGPPGNTGPAAIPSVAETSPVQHDGDAADDPAIWIDQDDPARSLVIGNDKKGALVTYDMSGQVVQQITTETFWGNVDVRGNYVAVMNKGITLYTVDPSTRELTAVTEGPNGKIKSYGEGLCMYQSPTDTYVVNISRKGRLRQYRLTDVNENGLIEGEPVRDLMVGSEAEGCVVDDATHTLYVSEEDVALWRYDADPVRGDAKIAVDTMTADGGHLVPDVEGLALAGNYLIASAQNGDDVQQSFFVLYDRTSHEYVGSFKIVDGNGSDGCEGTDGIAAYAGNLGPQFRHGIFVCQDTSNDDPGSAGNQNFKYVRWEDVERSG